MFFRSLIKISNIIEGSKIVHGNEIYERDLLNFQLSLFSDIECISVECYK